MLTKITFEEACNKTAEWLENELHIDPTAISYTQFDEYVDEFCKKFGYKIN